MPLRDDASIEITGFRWVPPFAQGLVRDLRARWALEEAGLDYRVELHGLERPDAYLREQPFDQVPVLRDGEVRIFETGAIVQYVAEKSGVLIPADTAGRYRAIQWSYAALNSVEPGVQNRALLDTFYAGEEWARLRKPTADTFARGKLKRVSDWLGDKPCLEGDEFTIGDLLMVSVLRLAVRAGLLDDLPNLAAYLERGEQRPAFKRALETQMQTYRENEPEGEAA